MLFISLVCDKIILKILLLLVFLMETDKIGAVFFFRKVQRLIEGKPHFYNTN